MPHKRSQFAKQRRAAARLVSLNAHRDTVKAESVNLLESGQLQRMLSEKFKGVYQSVVSMWDRGEVISDSYGEGTQQRIGIQDE
jgi:hypothetical protein